MYSPGEPGLRFPNHLAQDVGGSRRKGVHSVGHWWSRIHRNQPGRICSSSIVEALQALKCTQAFRDPMPALTSRFVIVQQLRSTIEHVRLPQNQPGKLRARFGPAYCPILRLSLRSGPAISKGHFPAPTLGILPPEIPAKPPRFTLWNQEESERGCHPCCSVQRGSAPATDLQSLFLKKLSVPTK